MKFKDTYYGDLTGQTYKGDIDLRDVKLTSLEGAPKIVNGSFYISNNEQLKSLEFGPEEVTSAFYASNCGLENLIGAPIKAHAFNISSNTLLTSLEGSPQQVLEYNCEHCNSLTTLEGISTMKDFGTVVAGTCDNLQSLKGIPKNNPANVSFYIYMNKKLTSLKGLPNKTGSISVWDCDLRDLEGAPSEVDGGFNISNNKKITSLKGCPSKVHGIDIGWCDKLTSLDYFPEVFKMFTLWSEHQHDTKSFTGETLFDFQKKHGFNINEYLNIYGQDETNMILIIKLVSRLEFRDLPWDDIKKLFIMNGGGI